jgi:hypothetical protein
MVDGATFAIEEAAVIVEIAQLPDSILPLAVEPSEYRGTEPEVLR